MKKKKDKRKIVVRGLELLWHLPPNWEIENQWLWVGTHKDSASLLIDPYPHDFEIRPKSIAEAIEFALNHGWDPKGKQNIKVRFQDGLFIICE